MLLLFLFLFSIFIALLFWYDYKVRVSCKLPGPPSVPILGNALGLIGSAGNFFQLVASSMCDYGTRSRILVGHKLIILISAPKDVEVVLNNQEFISKSDEYNFLHPWLGSGLLTSTGDKWKKHRKIITPAFHFKILENFIDVFEKQSEILAIKLMQLADKKSIDVYPIMGMYALDVVSETAMGVSLNAQNDEESTYVKAVKDECEVIHARIVNPFKRFNALLKLTPDYKKQQKALSIMHDFTNKMIQERRRLLQERQETLSSYTNETEDIYGRKKKMAFLDVLLLSTIDGKPLSDISIREEVDTFLFEGHDTTSSAISFCLYLLSKNEHVEQKLFDEQYEIFGDDLNRNATYGDFQNMKYLEMVIKETLRLYPSVPILGRKTSQDTNINDIEVKAGTTVAIMVYSMNRNPDIFPNPDQFIPERFTVEESSKRHPFSNVSFSAGSRNCIGQKFAMLQLKSCLSKIVRTFKLSAAEEKLEIGCGLLLKPVNGTFIKLQRRY